MTDYIFDIDGTLINVEARVEYAKKEKRDTDKVMNWDLFLNEGVMYSFDKPNWDVCDIFSALRNKAGNNMIITTARNERHREVTEEQLKDAGVWGFVKIYMRKDGDMRPDDIVKSELLEKIKKDGYNPTVAFDDRDQVVNMWRKLGIICYQVREGKF